MERQAVGRQGDRAGLARHRLAAWVAAIRDDACPRVAALRSMVAEEERVEALSARDSELVAVVLERGSREQPSLDPVARSFFG